MLLTDLEKKGLIHPPRWLAMNCQYLTQMGSVAYGVSTDTSDMDVYGWTIPPKEEVFPHLRGEILGFGRQKKRFEQYQEHHVTDPDALGGKGREYDFTIYNIVKYFDLCMENNPNMIDSLFVPQSAILHITRIGDIVRRNRKLFLHKGCWHKFRGYSFAQLHKSNSKNVVEKAKSVRRFEQKYDIPHSTTLEDVEKEMKKRGLIFQRLIS